MLSSRPKPTPSGPKKRWPGLLIPMLLMGGVSAVVLSHRPNPYAYPFTAVVPEAHLLEPVERELEFYQQRLQQQPDGLTRAALASAYFKMAQATGHTHWYLKADQTAQQALEILPHDNTEAILIRARVAEAKHEFDTAIALAQQVLDDTPHLDQAWSLLVTSYLSQGQVSEADQIVSQLVAKTPTLASYTLRSLVDIAKGDDRSARQSFQLALASEEPGELGSSEKLRVFWGKFLSSRGQVKTARNLLQSALKISPQSPQALVALAQLEQRDGNYQRAAELYSQVFQSQEAAHGLDHAAAAGRAALFQIQGQDAQAQDWWTRAEHSLRDHGELETFGHQRELAQLLLTRGAVSDRPEALALMAAEVKKRQDSATLEIYAWALSKQNRQSEALEVLQTAMNQGSKTPLIYFRAAAIARDLNQDMLAETYQTLGQTLDPSMPASLLTLWGVS